MFSGMAILFSLSVLVGHAYGAQAYKSIGNYVQQAWTLGIAISLPLIILFWYMDAILAHLGQSKELVQIVRDYFHAYVWAVVPAFLTCCNQQFGYGIHKKTLILVTSILSVVVLLISAYGLIFGHFGLPKLGVAGLGYASAIQATFFFVVTTIIFRMDKSFERFELFRYRVHHNLEHFTQMLSIGWPICVQMGGEMLSFFVGGIMIGWLGTSALAAFQVVNQYYFLIVIPVFSLAQASGILIGHQRGANQLKEIKKISQASIAITLGVSLIVALGFLLCPKFLASFYINIADPANAKTLKLTVLIFMVIALSQALDNVRNVLIGILRGLFDTRFPMYMSVVTIWLLGMPCSYILAFPLHLGVIGFVIGGAVGMLGGVLLMAYRYHWQIKNY
jgi:MATE family multidrug resistance protein